MATEGTRKLYPAPTVSPRASDLTASIEAIQQVVRDELRTVHTQLNPIAGAVRRLSTAGVNPDEMMTVEAGQMYLSVDSRPLSPRRVILSAFRSIDVSRVSNTPNEKVDDRVAYTAVADRVERGKHRAAIDLQEA